MEWGFCEKGEIMNIISRFVREQRRYTKNELKQLFLYDEQELKKFIKNLKSYGILKVVKNSREQKELSDLADDELLIADEAIEGEDYLYVFTYVGVITVGSRILKIYPKYLRKAADPLPEMKQVLKVLGRYRESETQVIEMYHTDGQNSCHILPVILYLLKDYYEYGVYNNSEDTVEINGEGEIFWEKTIDSCFPVIQNHQPFYLNYYTRHTAYDDMDYFKRLHECILTECSRQLHDTQLDELFDLVPVELSDAQLDDFGEKDYILERILNELNMQFHTRRQILLKTIHAYISQDRKLLNNEELGLSMYGTNAYHMVWEKVCADVFDNQLSMPLNRLKLSVPLAEKYDGTITLMDFIEKPVWETGGVEKYAKDTLRPDMIVVGQLDGADYFVILDAKYYHIQLEKDLELRGCPGVNDVTKQYLYEMAYQPFIREHGISIVKNYFILPTERNEIQKKGVVSMSMLHRLGLGDIQVCLVPAGLMYQHYLAGTHMDVSGLFSTKL